MYEMVGEQADRFAAVECMLQLRDDSLNQQAMIAASARTMQIHDVDIGVDDRPRGRLRRPLD